MLPLSHYNIIIIQFAFIYVIIIKYLVPIIILNKLLSRNKKNERFYFNFILSSQTLPDPNFFLFKNFLEQFLKGWSAGADLPEVISVWGSLFLPHFWRVISLNRILDWWCYFSFQQYIFHSSLFLFAWFLTRSLL